MNDKIEALCELEEKICELDYIASEIRGLVQENFPEVMPECDAYSVFDFGVSSNPYDTTISKIFYSLQSKYG